MSESSILSDGTKVYWKPYLTRGLKKEITQMLLGEITINKEGQPDNFKITSKFQADEILVLGMVDYFILEGKTEKVKPSDRWISNLRDTDFDILLNDVNEITKPKVDPKA